MKKLLLPAIIIFCILLISGCVRPIDATLSYKHCFLDLKDFCFVSQTISAKFNFENSEESEKDVKFKIKNQFGHLMTEANFKLDPGASSKDISFEIPSDSTTGKSVYRAFIEVGNNEYQITEFDIDIKTPQVSEPKLTCAGCNTLLRSETAEYEFVAQNKDDYLDEFKIEIQIYDDLKLRDYQNYEELSPLKEKTKRYTKTLKRPKGEDVGINFALVANAPNEGCADINLKLFVAIPDIEKEKNWYLIKEIDSSINPFQLRYCYPSVGY